MRRAGEWALALTTLGTLSGCSEGSQGEMPRARATAPLAQPAPQVSIEFGMTDPVIGLSHSLTQPARAFFDSNNGIDAHFVAWTGARDPNGSNLDIFGMRFDGEGNPLGRTA